MWLLASKVSADYYTRPPAIVSILMLTISYIQAMTLYIHRVGSTTIQCIACTGSWSWQPVSWVWRKWLILCLERNFNPHLWHSGLPDITTVYSAPWSMETTTIIMIDIYINIYIYIWNIWRKLNHHRTMQLGIPWSVYRRTNQHQYSYLCGPNPISAK